MTPEQFRAWRKALSMTQAEAATALGVSTGSILLYEAGVRRDDGRPVIIPRTVALACAAIRVGLAPEGDPERPPPG